MFKRTMDPLKCASHYNIPLRSTHLYIIEVIHAVNVLANEDVLANESSYVYSPLKCN